MRKFLAFIIPSLTFAMGSQVAPSQLIAAKLIDRSGKVHNVKAFVCDDKTYFTFRDGDVIVKVPFERIKKVEISPQGENLKVKVYFTDGKIKTFIADADIDCTGVNDYGTVEASLDKLKEIDFLNK